MRFQSRRISGKWLWEGARVPAILLAGALVLFLVVSTSTSQGPLGITPIPDGFDKYMFSWPTELIFRTRPRPGGLFTFTA